jgi:hypothetical protein
VPEARDDDRYDDELGGRGGKGEVAVAKSSVAISSVLPTDAPQAEQKRPFVGTSVPQAEQLGIISQTVYRERSKIGFACLSRLPMRAVASGCSNQFLLKQSHPWFVLPCKRCPVSAVVCLIPFFFCV